MTTDGPLVPAAPTLGQRGQVFVSLTAAQQHAAARDLPLETARRELTELLLDAREASDGSWRARKRSLDVDVSARVSQEGALLVVTYAHTRWHSQSSRGRGR